VAAVHAIPQLLTLLEDEVGLAKTVLSPTDFETLIGEVNPVFPVPSATAS
jgi:hypothetical protein